MELRTADLGGPIRYADFGGSGPTMVLVHGLGGSHVNWRWVGPRLAARGRVLAPDLAGFGLSPRAGRSTTVQANARLLGRFVREVAGAPAILVGNSMGALASLLLAAHRPALVSGLVLSAAAVPFSGGRPDRVVLAVFTAYAIPGVGELFVRRRVAALGPEGVLRESFAVCCADVSRLPPEVLQAELEMARQRVRQPWAQRSFLEGARSVVRAVLRPRAYSEILRRVAAPTLVVHGERDRLVSVVSARAVARRPGWSLEVLPDVGHLPMLEAPERFSVAVEGWLDGPGASAARAAAASGGAPPDALAG